MPQPLLFLMVIQLCFLQQTTIATAQKTSTVKERRIERILRKHDSVVGATHIIIDKSDGMLRLYDAAGLRARYPAVFGNEPDRDKFKAGDGRTPEGAFKITVIRRHAKWHLMLLLDYPTTESVKKFERRQKEGTIEEAAAIGGAIGIHGTWPHEAFLIDRSRHWTDGCVSLKNEHLADLVRYIKAGTTVEIHK